jgi:hypothetical protein
MACPVTPRRPLVDEATWAELAPAGPGAFFDRLGRALALRVPGFLPAARAAAYARRVYAGRPFWTPAFDGDQFSLGRAFYTHLEQGKGREYFAEAAASNAHVERLLPGLAALLVDAVGALTGGPAAPRPGWCGPGVHVFPAGGWLAGRGGDIHYDTEGLAARHAARREPALTLVLMLQPPEHGGELKVWDALYDGSEEVDAATLARPSALVPYGPGDLVVIDSYRLHQIQPFGGARDRVSATAHGALVGGSWQVWF